MSPIPPRPPAPRDQITVARTRGCAELRQGGASSSIEPPKTGKLGKMLVVGAGEGLSSPCMRLKEGSEVAGRSSLTASVGHPQCINRFVTARFCPDRLLLQTALTDCSDRRLRRTALTWCSDSLLQQSAKLCCDRLLQRIAPTDCSHCSSRVLRHSVTIFAIPFRTPLQCSAL